MVALVATAVEESGRLGIGPGDDDPRHPHDIELEAGRIEALDLLVNRDQNFAGLVTTFLNPRFLVFNMVAGHPDFGEPPNQVADVSVTAVAGVCIGDNEGAVVYLGNPRAFLLAHAQTQEILVAVSSEQCPDQWCGFIGNLAQGITGQVGARVLLDGALRRGGPATEVDAFDPHAFDGNGLARRIGAEGGNRLALAE